MKAAVFAMLVLLAGGPLHAKEGGDPFAVCRADVDRLCKNVKPGDGRQVKCMMENRASASPDCAAALNKKHQKEQEQQGKPIKVKP